MRICFLNRNDASLSLLFKDVFSIDSSSIDVKKALENNVRFLCAIEDDKVVGSIMVTKQYDPVKDSFSFYLDYVSVLPNYQNKGIATKLLKEMEDIAKKENISYIEFTSSKIREIARRLYFSLGYQIKDTDVFVKNIE